MDNIYIWTYGLSRSGPVLVFDRKSVLSVLSLLVRIQTGPEKTVCLNLILLNLKFKKFKFPKKSVCLNLILLNLKSKKFPIAKNLIRTTTHAHCIASHHTIIWHIFSRSSCIRPDLCDRGPTNNKVQPNYSPLISFNSLLQHFSLLIFWTTIHDLWSNKNAHALLLDRACPTYFNSLIDFKFVWIMRLATLFFRKKNTAWFENRNKTFPPVLPVRNVRFLHAIYPPWLASTYIWDFLP